MKLRKIVAATLATATVGLSLASCGSSVKNKDKGLVFFNRQPSDPDTGAIDTNAMNFNKNTYYVGFDAAGGGAVQGKLITDYLKTKTKAELDRNNDGVIGYVLCIGDIGHNDSKARTKGIREALGTWNNSYDPGTSNTKEGTVEVKDGTLKVKELESKEMKGTDGSTWNDVAAGEAASVWASKLTTQIDMLVSNNDGMAMGCIKKNVLPAGLPIFGYDANADAVAAIGEGKLTGTVSQNVDAQAAGTLQVLRNILDGVEGEEVVKSGISKADKYGNKITPEMTYVAESRALLAKNAPVTKDNWESYKEGSRDAGIKQTNAEKKKVLLTIYNSADNFLSSSYVPALQYYAPLMNIELNIQSGDGQSESTCLDKFIGLDKYDAYAINMVKTNSAQDYLNKLK